MKSKNPFKQLDCTRREFLRMPPNALKVWLYYYLREGKERIAWGSEEDITDVTGMSREVYYDSRRWLLDNGWLKPMGKKTRKEGGRPIPMFRVDEGSIPDTNDKRKHNNPSKARARKKELGLEAVEEFVGKNHTNQCLRNSDEPSLEKSDKPMVEKIRGEVEPINLEVEPHEVEPVLTSELVSSDASLRSSSTSLDERAETLYSLKASKTLKEEFKSLPATQQTIALVREVDSLMQGYAMDEAELQAMIRWAQDHKRFWADRIVSIEALAKAMRNAEEKGLVAQYRRAAASLGRKKFKSAAAGTHAAKNPDFQTGQDALEWCESCKDEHAKGKHTKIADVPCVCGDPRGDGHDGFCVAEA